MNANEFSVLRGHQSGLNPKSALSLKVISLMEEEAETIHSIKDIAGIMNMTTETIRKRFFRETGINLSEFISWARVERMKQLLIETDQPCKCICIHVGCREDVGAKLFKRITGLTMQRFRQEQGERRVNGIDSGKSAVILHSQNMRWHPALVQPEKTTY